MRKVRDKSRKNRQSVKRKAKHNSRPNRKRRYIVGIDGEGFDLPDGRHIYTLLSAVSEDGRVVGEVENQEGLSSIECVQFLLDLPKNSLKFIFMGSYDWTKIIEDLDPVDIYYIMHPDTRRERMCKHCKHKWVTFRKSCPECGLKDARSIQRLRYVSSDKYKREIKRAFDWFNGSFTVGDYVPGITKRRKVWNRRTKVWDCFKFFQKSFVGAIKDWNIGTQVQWDRIEAMKKRRGSFHEEKPENIKKYCREECHLLALMMRAVLNACSDAGIELTRFEGAGSIAGALLKHHKVKDFMGPALETLPAELYNAVMSAYFGGRFENSVVGAITEPVYNRDIYSAYPYAITMLPCLACGEWKPGKTLEQARAATLGLVHFRVKERSEAERTDMPWAPLPCRLKDGSITYPTGFEGWAWLPEFEQALKGWPDLVEVLDVWTYTTTCGHKPFAWVPDAYRKRFEWGKDGRGIVMKLGLNACAGKTMQNVGDPPPFKSFIWGGMITATTRGQALSAIIAAKNRWNVLAIATDGVFETENLNLTPGHDTGTNDLKKPLGHWGCEKHEQGVFFVKPGMYYDQTASLMRARGIGRQELTDTRQKLIDAFSSWDRESELSIRVVSRRFYGARTSVLAYSRCLDCDTFWPGVPTRLCPKCGLVGKAFRVTMMKIKDTETPGYGRWAVRDIDIEYNCFPKREFIEKGGTYGRMRIRDMGGIASLSYAPGITTPEGIAARQAQDEALEEPDWLDTDEEVAA